MNKLTILKIIGVIMGGIAGTIGLILLFNFLSFSCISKPEFLKEEPTICKEAKTWTYYSAVTKNPAANIDASIGNKACRDKLRYDDCKTEFDAYLKNNMKDDMDINKRTTILNEAKTIYLSCQNDMK